MQLLFAWTPWEPKVKGDHRARFALWTARKQSIWLWVWLPIFQLQFDKYNLSFMGVGKSRFTVVSSWSRVFIIALFIYLVFVLFVITINLRLPTPVSSFVYQSPRFCRFYNCPHFAKTFYFNSTNTYCSPIMCLVSLLVTQAESEEWDRCRSCPWGTLTFKIPPPLCASTGLTVWVRQPGYEMSCISACAPGRVQSWTNLAARRSGAFYTLAGEWCVWSDSSLLDLAGDTDMPGWSGDEGTCTNIHTYIYVHVYSVEGTGVGGEEGVIWFILQKKKKYSLEFKATQ